jgi:hypothetical protein
MSLWTNILTARGKRWYNGLVRKVLSYNRPPMSLPKTVAGSLKFSSATSGARTAYPTEALEFTPGFSGVHVTRSLVLCVCFVDRCLYFFFWPLCCLFFCDIRILITPLVSSKSSSPFKSHSFTFGHLSRFCNWFSRTTSVRLFQRVCTLPVLKWCFNTRGSIG